MQNILLNINDVITMFLNINLILYFLFIIIYGVNIFILNPLFIIIKSFIIIVVFFTHKKKKNKCLLLHPV